MEHEQIESFLNEAVSADPGADEGLSRDELFGLYTSWCFLNQRKPVADSVLWAKLRERQINPDHNTLAMIGPAAADYILASAPAIT
ncbi:hypothetical protein PSET11_00612 [Arthrobacter ulcerisalmonis]|uniref:DNA primase/nucleoside triphosphatase C-terminal domain-containing protein n=1 Tax=Arthrobacter ulcerisalmonis TaxID=2483813 RepID=A0A3P5WHH2_9MICC|nr:hypothetical protein [Arthrobacter ulcerisalmonis]VDC20875.1 hypothetical protein PSET11_00612 [Arthrobacter ulcerisalmonis]